MVCHQKHLGFLSTGRLVAWCRNSCSNDWSSNRSVQNDPHQLEATLESKVVLWKPELRCLRYETFITRSFRINQSQHGELPPVITKKNPPLVSMCIHLCNICHKQRQMVLQISPLAFQPKCLDFDFWTHRGRFSLLCCSVLKMTSLTSFGYFIQINVYKWHVCEIVNTVYISTINISP